MMFLKSAEIDVRARKMCSLKFASPENKNQRTSDNSGDDV